MKKFAFSLDKILSYKEQVENSLRNEHAQILQAVSRQEKLIEDLEYQHLEYGRQYEQKRIAGSTIQECNVFESYLETLRRRLTLEQERLLTLKRQEEEKRQQVLEAKSETASIDKLKDRRKREYSVAVRKEEESLIEEFVSNLSSSRKHAIMK